MKLLDIFKETRGGFFSSFVPTKPAIFQGKSDHFKPNHDVFPNLTMWCLCLNLTRTEAQRCDKTEKNRQPKETFGCNLSVVLQKRTSLTFILVFPSVAPYSRCPFIRVRIKYSPRSWCKCFEEFPFLCFKGFSCVRQVKWKLRSLFSPLTACKRNTVLPYTSQ